jgi:hypothetical protein
MYSDVAQPEPTPTYGALMQGTPGVEAYAPEQPLAMGRDEISQVGELIQQYSNYPGVAAEFAKLVTANAQNPEHLASLVRQMVDQIEQVKADPHKVTFMNPAIEGVVNGIREVELQKPDPLNVFRGNETPEQKKEAEPLTLGTLLAGRMAADGLAADKGLQNLMLATNHEPEVPALTQSPLAQIPGIGDVANMFKAALTNFEPSQQQAQTGPAQRRGGFEL